MKCTKCGKPIKEDTEGNKRYCQGHSVCDIIKFCNHCKKDVIVKILCDDGKKVKTVCSKCGYEVNGCHMNK